MNDPLLSFQQDFNHKRSLTWGSLEGFDFDQMLAKNIFLANNMMIFHLNLGKPL